jgi:hypothetical protein
MTRVATRSQANVLQIWVCYEAKARGAFRIRLNHTATKIDIPKTNHKHKVDNMASVNKPRASATARASAL